MTDNNPHRQKWMSDDQWRCAECLADIFGGFHHLFYEIKRCGDGIETQASSSFLSTFDFDYLTRLVFLAHDRAIRMTVGASGPRLIKITAFARKRDGKMSQRHPTLEEAIATHRSIYISKPYIDEAAQ